MLGACGLCYFIPKCAVRNDCAVTLDITSKNTCLYVHGLTKRAYFKFIHAQLTDYIRTTFKRKFHYASTNLTNHASLCIKTTNVKRRKAV